MSSIVTEVLQTSGKLAKENIILKVDDLKRKLEIIKLTVQDNLSDFYINFLPYYVKPDKFLVQLKKFTEDYEDINCQVEKEVKPQIADSISEFQDVLEDLKKMKKLKLAVWNLVVMHQCLEGAKNFKCQSAYFCAAHHLIEFDTAFEEIEPNLLDINILIALKQEFYIAKEGIIHDINQIWEENIEINSHTEGKNKKKVTLSINKDIVEYEGIFKALYLLNYLRPILKGFGNKFLKTICETLILNNVKVSINEISTQRSTLTIDIRNEHQALPSEVFVNLITVFKFLYDELLAMLVTDEDTEKCCMNEFSAVISEDFYSLVVEKCLKATKMSQMNQSETFNSSTVVNFYNDLQAIGFRTSSNNSLLNFIESMDILPLNEMAQDILCKARSLMKKNLRQTVAVGVECVQTVEVNNSYDMNDTHQSKNSHNKATFCFQRCQVSISVIELVKLLKEVKDKITSATHLVKLYNIVRSICELYCCVVPTFHKKTIQNVPHQAAIFHNNCMYLAHELCILGNYYAFDLQAGIPMTFIDLVPEIKKLGTEAFLLQMRHQREQLKQHIQEKKVFRTVMIDEDLVTIAEKSIRQCLSLLQFLQKEWSDVLPFHIYFKSIGTLFNTCLEEIILCVLSMQDISIDAIAQMDTIFSILVKQGLDLFKIQNIDERNSVHCYVKRWFKFQELQFILGANMKEIVDRWSSGKGPLASQFNTEDVKNLIRALFPNNKKREAALARVK